MANIPQLGIVGDAILALVVSVLANGSLIHALNKQPVVYIDLYESLALFHTALNLVSLHWHTHSSIVVLQVIRVLADCPTTADGAH